MDLVVFGVIWLALALWIDHDIAEEEKKLREIIERMERDHNEH